jgi:uncharacterized membrane protein
MKKFFKSVRDVAVSGFFFLFPVYVVFIVLSKAWTSLSSLGGRVAALFGVKPLLGVGAPTIVAAFLMVLIWIVCGLLVRLSFMNKASKALENVLARFIPGYETYRNLAEEKLQRKTRILPYAAGLIKQQECWRPAFIVEQDDRGNYVVFVPDTPETNKGHVLLATADQVRTLPSITANQVDASLRAMGKGLLSELGAAKG